MKFYGSSTLLWGHSCEYIFDRFASAGLEGVELWAEQLWHEKWSAREVYENAKSHGLDLTLHAASWDLNISSLNKGIRKQSIKEIKNSLELAQMLNISNVTMHPGRLTLNDDWEQFHIEVLQESLDELEAFAIELGITISLELMEFVKKEFITSAPSLNNLVDHRSEFMMTTFDVAHSPLWLDPKKILKELHKVNKIHLSDSTNEKFHVPLGEGSIDIPPVMKLIEKFQVPIVIEGYDFLEEGKIFEKNIQYLLRNGHLRKQEVYV